MEAPQPPRTISALRCRAVLCITPRPKEVAGFLETQFQRSPKSVSLVERRGRSSPRPHCSRTSRLLWRSGTQPRHGLWNQRRRWGLTPTRHKPTASNSVDQSCPEDLGDPPSPWRRGCAASCGPLLCRPLQIISFGGPWMVRRHIRRFASRLHSQGIRKGFAY